MKRVKLHLLVFLTVVCMQNAFAFDDGDFQYWNTETLSVELADVWKMDIEEEFRFGDDSSDFYYQHSDAGIIYSGLNKWLDLGLNYRLVFEKDDGDWEYENRPHINAVLKKDMAAFELSDRNRFEYRDKEHSNDGWRYRNKLTIKLPFKLTGLNIRPFVADEIFVDFDKEELNRNRLYAGFSLKLSKKLKGDIFHLWQSTKSNGSRKDYYILGTKLKLGF